MANVSKILHVDKTLFAGIDVGGTKVAILDSSSENIHRYATNEYTDLTSILDDYFSKISRRPVSVALSMAGPRDDETGAIRLTNGTWPTFEPSEAERRYPGTRFETVNDMIGTAAGVLAEPRVELVALKEGRPSEIGTKLVLAVSTGFGAAAAVWDQHTKRHVFMASEGGHIGIQPENEEEANYLRYLQEKYVHVSAELALSGKEGVDNLIDHILTIHYSTELVGAIKKAREADRPVGAVILEYATEGEGTARDVARRVLATLGSMLGSAIRDLAVAFKPTGGIYLTGSLALALGEFLAAETDFIARFVHKGAVHETWIDKIPIYLVADPHVAVRGALSLASRP